MAHKIPKKLRKEPLIEAIWQVQFQPVENHPIAEILPGVIFTAMRSEIPGLQLKRLPAAEIPPIVAQHDPNLRFAAKYRIESPESPFIFQVGDQIVTVNCRKPYSGWAKFKLQVLRLASLLDETGVILRPQRHSIRYVDLLTLESPPSLSSLRMTLVIGDSKVQDRPLQLRVELPDTECLHVLQVVTPAQINLPEGERTGTLIDLETVSELKGNSLSELDEDLERIHAASKRLFFEQVLTQKAIMEMDPVD